MSNLSKQFHQEAERLAEIIAKKYKPEKIIFYGSAARGKVTENSDIDLCIIKKSKLPLHKRIVQVYNSIEEDWDWKRAFEPIIFTPEEFEERKRRGNYFIENILKDGKVLYEKKT